MRGEKEERCWTYLTHFFGFSTVSPRSTLAEIARRLSCGNFIIVCVCVCVCVCACVCVCCVCVCVCVCCVCACVCVCACMCVCVHV